MDDAARQALLRALPSIDELLTRPSLAPVLGRHPRPIAVLALRQAVAAARARVLAGEAFAFDDRDVARALEALTRPGLRPVLNATGVVLHTNLGRAPLPERAVARLTQLARGYTNLELDLEGGERGSRYAPVVEALKQLTCAEDALVVNNCAAATLLVLSELAQGKGAIVSRGELVEIGGGFRIPEVMRQSGAKLVEVGTTNRTRLEDYASAIDAESAVLLKVHRSNFAVVGFTEEVPTRALAPLAKARGLVLYEDLGSGVLSPLHGEHLTLEPTVASVVNAGADVVTFSGDKLLGGPQAGIIVGRADLIARLKKHPLNRALRIDKLTVAALEATLELYRAGLEDQEVPTRALLLQSKPVLERRATALKDALCAHGLSSRVLAVQGQVGGGAMPLAEPPSFAATVDGAKPEALAQALRTGDPAVLARVSEGALLLDIRCIADDQVGALAARVSAARQEAAC
jgi:L-seryl-tRNA(Ser) seleniumtransferase